MHLEGLLRSRGRLVAPQCLDQPIARDDLVRTQQQDGEQEPLFLAFAGQKLVAAAYLERTEDLEFHFSEP
jgi:hypothetical protein